VQQRGVQRRVAQILGPAGEQIEQRVARQLHRHRLVVPEALAPDGQQAHRRARQHQADQPGARQLSRDRL
jgi:hypothetical protein